MSDNMTDCMNHLFNFPRDGFTMQKGELQEGLGPLNSRILIS